MNGLSGLSGLSGLISADTILNPTTLLMLPWLPGTATFLKDATHIAGNGDVVTSWTPLAGADWTSALAIGAEALAGPLLDTANGINDEISGRALTTGTPITIPANTDFDLWVLAVIDATGTLYALGRSVTSNDVISITASDVVCENVEGDFIAGTGPGAGAKLFRISIVAGVAKIAWTGQAEFAASDEGFSGGALVLDTVLASGNTVNLAHFSDAGNYLKAIRIDIYPDGYTGRVEWQVAVETAAFAAGGFNTTPL